MVPPGLAVAVLLLAPIVLTVVSRRTDGALEASWPWTALSLLGLWLGALGALAFWRVASGVSLGG